MNVQCIFCKYGYSSMRTGKLRMFCQHESWGKYPKDVTEAPMCFDDCKEFEVSETARRLLKHEP